MNGRQRRAEEARRQSAQAFAAENSGSPADLSDQRYMLRHQPGRAGLPANFRVDVTVAVNTKAYHRPHLRCLRPAEWLIDQRRHRQHRDEEL